MNKMNFNCNCRSSGISHIQKRRFEIMTRSRIKRSANQLQKIKKVTKSNEKEKQ